MTWCDLAVGVVSAISFPLIILTGGSEYWAGYLALLWLSSAVRLVACRCDSAAILFAEFFLCSLSSQCGMGECCEIRDLICGWCCAVFVWRMADCADRRLDFLQRVKFYARMRASYQRRACIF